MAVSEALNAGPEKREAARNVLTAITAPERISLPQSTFCLFRIVSSSYPSVIVLDYHRG